MLLYSALTTRGRYYQLNQQANKRFVALETYGIKLGETLVIFVPQMAESVIRALYGKRTSLNLTSQKIKEVPQCVYRLTNLSVLLLNNNSITALPRQLLSLTHVSLRLFSPSSSVCSKISKITP